MSRRVPFARWIEDLEYEVIQREFGYEDGEFTVYPDHWRAQWKRGDTPLQAFQSALDAYAEARREKDAERAANWQRIERGDLLMRDAQGRLVLWTAESETKPVAAAGEPLIGPVVEISEQGLARNVTESDR